MNNNVCCLMKKANAIPVTSVWRQTKTIDCPIYTVNSTIYRDLSLKDNTIIFFFQNFFLVCLVVKTTVFYSLLWLFFFFFLQTETTRTDVNNGLGDKSNRRHGQIRDRLLECTASLRYTRDREPTSICSQVVMQSSISLLRRLQGEKKRHFLLSTAIG